MANTPQAKKRIRRNERRAEINGNRIGRIRTLVKKVESAIEAGDKTAATTALQTVQPDFGKRIPIILQVGQAFLLPVFYLIHVHGFSGKIFLPPAKGL